MKIRQQYGVAKTYDEPARVSS